MKPSVRHLVLLSLLLAAAPATLPTPARAAQDTPAKQDAPAKQETPPKPDAATAAPAATLPARAEGKAVVFVYRPGKLVGKALEPSVFCDGVEVGRMDNGRYIVLLLDPGEHRIHMTQDNKRVDFKLGAGEAAFVRIKIVMGMMKGRGEPVLADEKDAAENLKKSEPLGADKFKPNPLAVTDRAEAEAILKQYVR
ncbi:MAG: DUF2846 domain-containing protein [Pyrinomonadaceae bacterium]